MLASASRRRSALRRSRRRPRARARAPRGRAAPRGPSPSRAPPARRRASAAAIARSKSPASRQWRASAPIASLDEPVDRSKNSATTACRRARSARGRSSYATSRISTCVNVELLLVLDDRARLAPDQVAALELLEHVVDVGLGAQREQRVVPEHLADTAASRSSARSRGGSASRRAATRPRMLVGSAPSRLPHRRGELLDEQRVAFRDPHDRVGAVGRRRAGGSRARARRPRRAGRA